MIPGKPRILLLHEAVSRHVGTIDHHLTAIEALGTDRLVSLDCISAARLPLDLNRFDSVVFHYSIVISSPSHLPAAFASRLTAFRGIKVLIIQDEMRWVDRTAEAARRLGVDVLFTVTPPGVTRKIYRDPWFDHVRFEHTLTGFVPEHLTRLEVPDYAGRPLDVSYRARKLSGWLGSFARQKWLIGERFAADAPSHGLKCDISSRESDRLYGKDWINLVMNSRAVLGTGSGSSFVDFSGETAPWVEAYEAAHPEASFAVIRDLFLEGRDGETVIDVISPRCFEAAALRTLMILYPGPYSGILQPWRHYAPLDPDHGNMAEIVRLLRSPDQAGEIIGRAYREIACSGRWTYNRFAAHLDRVITEMVQARLQDGQGSPLPRLAFYNDGELAKLRKANRRLFRLRMQVYRLALLFARLEGYMDRKIRPLLPGAAGEKIAAVWQVLKGYAKRQLLDG